MGTTEHEEPRFFFILNKGAKSGGEITMGRAAFARADTRLNRRDCRFLPIRVFGLSGFSLKVNGFVR